MIQNVSPSYGLVYAISNLCDLAIRRVLHLKMVTQCAMLEDFGIFLVLADKVNSFPPLDLLTLTDIVGSLRVPYRGTRSVITAGRTYSPSSSEAQWHKGRAFLQRWYSFRKDSHHLHEEEICKASLLALHRPRQTNFHIVEQYLPSP